jgi:hypothetical protein
VHGMKRTLNEIARRSATKPEPTAGKQRGKLHRRRLCGEAPAAVFRRGTTFRDREQRLPCAGNWNRRSRTSTVWPMRIFLLRPATHLHLTSHDAASRKSTSRPSVWSFVLLLRVKASLSELDLGALGASRFRRMLRPPFRDALGEGRGCLIAGSLQ